MNERTQRLLLALAEAPDWLTEVDDATEEERRSLAWRTTSSTDKLLGANVPEAQT